MRLTIALLFFAACADAQTLMLSDIHLDPFADASIVCRLASSPVENWTAIFQSSTNTKLPPYDSDTTYPLFQSTLEAAKARKYDRVIVSGDYLRHNFQQAFQQTTAACQEKNAKLDFPAFVTKTMRYVSRRIQETFPTLPVINAFGNNDSACGDYEIAPDDPMLTDLAKEWRVRGDSFRIGGYYSIPVQHHEFVVLNSVFWSAKYKDACGSRPADPGAGECPGWRGRSIVCRLRRKRPS